MSGDPEQEYFCDGISENIISALSKISEIFVISRNSTFTYKGKPTKAQHVAEELGVQYILEGSVQKSEDQIRVTAQLIDATAGIHIWSDRYDRSINELFEVQDDITHEIIVALQVELTDGEQALMRYKSTKDLDAWSYAVRGMSLFERLNKADNEKAKKLFRRAVELDPNYTWAWTMLAWTYLMEAKDGYVHLNERGNSVKKSLELAQKALKFDVRDPEVHTLLGLIYLSERQHDKAIAEGKQAIALGPNNADVHALFANILRFSGKFAEAELHMQEAMRLSPYHREWYLWELGLCYYYLGRYEEMLAIGRKYLKMAENRGIRNMAFGGHFLSSLSLVRLGKIDEARSHIKEALKILPFYSIWFDRQVSYYKNPEDLDSQHQDLRKAGLPEYSPS
jgi:TolB-like protein/Tfp pilus assembly protein PilF